MKRNPAYYNVALAAKFVRPGSARIASDEPKSLPNVVFKTPDGHTVLIVLNDSPVAQPFRIESGSRPVPGWRVGPSERTCGNETRES